MAYKRELTSQEKAIKKAKREKLLQKYPGGIAEIEAVWTRREPAVEGRPSPLDFQSPIASSTPAIPVYVESGGTHPTSGLPEVKGKKIDISIWPISGRTDQAGELNKYYEPIEILEFLADDRMRLHHGRPIYRLKPVPVAIMEAERKALTNPESRKEFERMKASGSLMQTTEPVVGSSTRIAAVPIDQVEEGDQYEQLGDEDMVDEMMMSNVEEEESVV